jgi:cytochrome c oxidase subunit 2
MRIPMWFRPIKAGKYEVVCAQLCGAGHYGMKADMIVEEATDFDAWQKETITLQHPEAAAAAPAPAPAAPATPTPAPAAPVAK